MAFQRKLEKTITKKGETTHSVMGVNRTLNDMITDAGASKKESAKAMLLKIKHEGVMADIEEVSKLARTGRIVQHKGNVINADRLAFELEEKTKRLATLNETAKPDIKAIETTLRENKMPFGRVVHEGKDQYLKRITKDYERLTGKPVPTDKAVFDAEATELKSRIETIKTILREASPGQDVGSAMKNYNDYSSNEYFGRFGRGAVKRATGGGTEGAMAPEHIPGAFKSPSGADSFIRAVGSRDKAAALIKENINHDLLQNATDNNGEVTTRLLTKWLKKNRAVLSKYGIHNEYSSLGKATAEAEKAYKNMDVFKKSAFEKIIKADADKIFQASLNGSDIGHKARELYETVKHDKDALAGLQKAFSDHLITSSEKALVDIADEKIMSPASINQVWGKYSYAIREIYKDSPEKIKALMTIKNAVETMSRNAKSPTGGGSDTHENIMNNLFNILGATIGSKGPLKYAKFIMEPFNKVRDSEIANYVNRALFDPEFAETLIKGASGKIPPVLFKRQVKRQMSMKTYAGDLATETKKGSRAATVGTEAYLTNDQFENDREE